MLRRKCRYLYRNNIQRRRSSIVFRYRNEVHHSECVSMPELTLPKINYAHAPDCAHACKVHHAIQCETIYVSKRIINEQMNRRIPF